jgi:hypothetical protein
MPPVKTISKTKLRSIEGICERVMVSMKRIGIIKRISASIKWTRLDRMIDKGITDLGNFAFFMRDRSLTIHGVPLVRDNEKKFQTRSPMKR